MRGVQAIDTQLMQSLVRRSLWAQGERHEDGRQVTTSVKAGYIPLCCGQHTGQAVTEQTLIL